MDGSDKTFHFAYDQRWRVIATYRESDSSPKEQFIYHCAGADGQGGSSYIDAIILRDQDANTTWTSAADGVLEKRDYYCQNWRSDVVCMITASGAMGGWVKYSAYGIPYGIPAGDTNGDGTANSTDSTNITTWTGTGNGVTHPTGDLNLDGNIDTTDSSLFAMKGSVTLGWGKLSQASATSGGYPGANRKGYAGYEFDPVLADSNWHVRHRVLKSDLGRWTRRDPLGYVDGPSKYCYVRDNPVRFLDSLGLTVTFSGSCAGSSIADQCWDDPLVQFALAYMNNHCQAGSICPNWNVVCNSMPKPPGNAITCCQTCTIHIFTTTANCQTLAHELIHAGDHCSNNDCVHGNDQTVGPCGSFGNGQGQFSCVRLLCSEVRAYAMECCNQNPPPVGFAFWDCVMHSNVPMPASCSKKDFQRAMNCCMPSDCNFCNGNPPGGMSPFPPPGCNF